MSPSMAHLRGFAEGGSVEIAEDLEAQLRRQRGEEVDFEETADVGGDERQLGKTACRQDALQHEVALPCWRGGEECPYVGYALLVGLGFFAKFLGTVRQ